MTEVLQTPIKSANDKKFYRLIKLENGLKVLLIQHPKEIEGAEKLAAVILSVDVGGYDDPKDAKGLSHFLEHMLFMGSEKYPQENEYSEFVSSNGGFSNAYTTIKSTAYFFQVSENALDGAIDRFSSIFIGPLINENSVMRELEAIESEFNNGINDDYRRMTHVIYDNMKDDHPCKSFIVGSKKTIKGERTNAELRQLVYEHYRKFYVANRMTLAIASQISLDEQQIMIEKYFNDIQVGEIRQKSPSDAYKNIFKPQFFNKVQYIKPRTDKRNLHLLWPIPPAHKFYKSKSVRYISKLLKSQHLSGLVSHLKKKLLITSLSSYFENGVLDDKDDGTLFVIDISMTDFGSKNVTQILDGIYSYLLQIKETPMENHREIFDDYQKISEINFRFKDDRGSLGSVRDVIRMIDTFEDLDVLRGSDLFLEYDEENLRKFIEILNEGNFGIIILDYDAQVEYNEIEPYYGSEIKRCCYEEFRRCWDERKTLPDLLLPPKNNYIPSNFEILSDTEGVEKMKHPEKIFENEIAESWYKLDSEFKVPKALVYIKLGTPLLKGSPFNVALTKILLDITAQILNEKYASASDVGLSCSFWMYDNNYIEISFDGYNEKLGNYLNDVMKDFRNIHEKLSESIFNVQRMKNLENYRMRIKNGSFTSAMLTNLLAKDRANMFNIYSEFSRISFDNLKKFIEKIFKKLCIQILIQGNISREEAAGFTNNILSNINAEPLDDLLAIETSTYQLPEGRMAFKMKTFMKESKNSKIQDHHDLGPRSATNNAFSKLLELLFSEPIFDTLRTKEQLGYTVFISHNAQKNSNILTITLQYQEDKHSSKSITERVKNFFVEDMKSILENLSDEKFQKIKQSEITKLRRKFQRLQSEVNYNFDRIMNKTYIFDEYEKQALVLEGITKENVIDFYTEKLIANKHRNLRLILVGNVDQSQIEGDNEDLTLKLITEKYDEEEEIVRDLKTFQETLQLHPKYIPNYQNL